MIDFELNAEPRHDKGKGASRRLRRTNQVPGILYGAGKKAMMLQVNANELNRKLEHEAFYSHILTIKIGGQEERAVLKDLHRHPARPTVQHFDLLRVSESDKIRMHVPLHFTGEEDAPGVKRDGGIVSHLAVEAEIECFPRDLPEFIEVDVSAMEVGDSIHLSQLKLPAGVELVELMHGDEHDQAVVNIHLPRTAKEEVPAVEAAAPKEAPKEGGQG